MQQQQQLQDPAPTPAGAGHDLMAQLTQLARSHQAGVLTDDELAAARARLLG